MDNPSTYTDDRGTIKDLLVTDDYSVTHITFESGAVRGNHYHENTTQYDLVLKGKLLAAQNDKEQIVNEQAVILNQPNDKHAYKALEYSEIISICFGVRKGSDYEKDVIKLEVPLLK